MDIKQALELAGGRPAVAETCKMTRQSIQLWVNNNRLPLTEISGRSSHAKTISDMAKARGHDISPSDICPGAVQYMQQPKEKSA